MLAVLLKERGAEIVLGAQEALVMSTVNLAECVSRIVREGGDGGLAFSEIDALIDRIEDVDVGMAMYAASLAPIAKPLGISLADRFCLALARRYDAEVYCSDNRMAELDIGLKITRIRQPREKR